MFGNIDNGSTKLFISTSFAGTRNTYFLQHINYYIKRTIPSSTMYSLLILDHVEAKERQDGGTDEGPEGRQGNGGIADRDDYRSWCFSIVIGIRGGRGAHGGGNNEGGACDLLHFHGGGLADDEQILVRIEAAESESNNHRHFAAFVRF